MIRSLASIAMLAIALNCPTESSCDILSISDGVASFDYGSDEPSIGNANLVSASDILYQETWFIRNNHPLLGPATWELTGGIAQASGYSGSLSFAGVGGGINTSGFDIVLSYAVQDAGGVGTLRYSASITNTNPFAEDISLFHYFDHDLNGASRDSATYQSGRIEVADAGGLSTFREFTRADHWQVGDYDDDIDGALRNGSLVSLPDTGAVFGPGDFAAALQWDLTLLAQETVVIRGTIGVPLSTIPEPSGVWLAGLATALVLLRRRRTCAPGD